MSGASWPVIQIAGLPFSVITEPQTVQHIVRSAIAGEGGWVVTPNLDILRQCVASPQVAAFARQADLMVADGMPLVWASRLQGTPLPGRVAGSNLVEAISYDRMSALIRQSAPDIIYVAIGFPKQERLIHAASSGAQGVMAGHRHQPELQRRRSSRAPAWMQRCGLEWMHRMAQDPRRLVRRYLIYGVPFAIRLLFSAVWARTRHLTAK